VGILRVPHLLEASSRWRAAGDVIQPRTERVSPQSYNRGLAQSIWTKTTHVIATTTNDSDNSLGFPAILTTWGFLELLRSKAGTRYLTTDAAADTTRFLTSDGPEQPVCL
jgi:hypothetical protein